MFDSFLYFLVLVIFLFSKRSDVYLFIYSNLAVLLLPLFRSLSFIFIIIAYYYYYYYCAGDYNISVNFHLHQILTSLLPSSSLSFLLSITCSSRLSFLIISIFSSFSPSLSLSLSLSLYIYIYITLSIFSYFVSFSITFSVILSFHPSSFLQRSFLLEALRLPSTRDRGSVTNGSSPEENSNRHLAAKTHTKAVKSISVVVGAATFCNNVSGQKLTPSAKKKKKMAAERAGRGAWVFRIVYFYTLIPPSTTTTTTTTPFFFAPPSFSPGIPSITFTRFLPLSQTSTTHSTRKGTQTC